MMTFDRSETSTHVTCDCIYMFAAVVAISSRGRSRYGFSTYSRHSNAIAHAIAWLSKNNHRAY
eukprot:3227-Heterococcus_DN1.PRE.2